MEAPSGILVVEVEQAVFERIAPLLGRRSFEVDRFPDAGRALELLGAVPFRAVIVGYPLREMQLEDFLSAVRSGSSSAASVAVLTTAEHRARAEGLLGGDVDLVLAAEKAPQETQRLLCALLDVSPRAAMRVLVRLDVRLDGAQSDKFLAQTEDISTSGMLVVTPKRYPVGSRARFALTLPIDPQPIQGEAEVTRHTDPASDRVRGMGFRFMAFAPADAERLQGYVNAVAGQTPKAR